MKKTTFFSRVALAVNYLLQPPGLTSFWNFQFHAFCPGLGRGTYFGMWFKDVLLRLERDPHLLRQVQVTWASNGDEFSKRIFMESALYQVEKEKQLALISEMEKAKKRELRRQRRVKVNA